ncbi:hypothetical protein HID58_072456 [Brassica napus]|uniref:Uncharacterized protein n=1 Tax=Brassica napus TaxID=3708 RepID=A0ABQ7Z4P5_BRANA|nr:hypothetical protein HID58_072456 [Brassica napus]
MEERRLWLYTKQRLHGSEKMSRSGGSRSVTPVRFERMRGDDRMSDDERRMRDGDGEAICGNHCVRDDADTRIEVGDDDGKSRER